MSLYNISSGILKIQQLLEEQDDQYEENNGRKRYDFSMLFEKLQDDFNTKLSNCVKYIMNQQSLSNSVDAEIKRLEKLKKSYQARSDRMKKDIDTILKIQKIDSIDTDIARLSYLASEWVVISDEKIIPKKYMTTKIEVKPSLSLIKEAIKAWHEVPGAIIEQRQNLQIK